MLDELPGDTPFRDLANSLRGAEGRLACPTVGVIASA